MKTLMSIIRTKCISYTQIQLKRITDYCIDFLNSCMRSIFIENASTKSKALRVYPTFRSLT